MRIGSLEGLGLSLGQMLKLEAAQKDYESVEGTARNVIQIRLGAGVAAQESWNPKPDALAEYRGPFGVTKTPNPGIVLGEMMPQTAKIADKLTVVNHEFGAPDSIRLQLGWQVRRDGRPGGKPPSLEFRITILDSRAFTIND